MSIAVVLIPVHHILPQSPDVLRTDFHALWGGGDSKTKTNIKADPESGNLPMRIKTMCCMGEFEKSPLFEKKDKE